MNKAQLVEQLASEMEITKADCERILDSTLEAVKKSVKKGEDVTLVGFGTFTRSKRKARMGRNPQTGEAIKVSWPAPFPSLARQGFQGVFELAFSFRQCVYFRGGILTGSVLGVAPSSFWGGQLRATHSIFPRW